MGGGVTKRFYPYKIIGGQNSLAMLKRGGGAHKSFEVV